MARNLAALRPRASLGAVSDESREPAEPAAPEGKPNGGKPGPGKAKPGTGERGKGKMAGAVGRGLRILRLNAYLGLVIGAGLVLTRTVEFSPPPEVRTRTDDGAGLIGEAPAQEFSEELGNTQAVQLRATLRQYPDPQMEVSTPDPEIDEHARMLSQPVITTIIGMNATVEQTVRLDGGELEIDLAVHATPRLLGKAKRGKPPPLTLEQEILVKSRRSNWLDGTQSRIHIDSRGTLMNVEDRGYRLVFTVDDNLFALDLELNRPYG